ncbi:MAG: family 16 glycosylhydrolase [Pseudomonadota bacterium]
MSADTTQPYSSNFIDDFKTLDLTNWSVAEYDFSHPHFDTDWRKSNVSVDAAGLKLQLFPHSAGLNPFVGASLRRHEKTHFGRYSAILRPAKGDGLVTGFFVYSGPAYQTRHDEIDIEFLGRDTTLIHLATFVDGELENHFVDLGFDAAVTEREYGFDWYPDKIIWWVDGCEIYRWSQKDGPVPSVPGYVFANLWAVDPALDSWAGRPARETLAQSYVNSVRFTPFLGLE